MANAQEGKMMERLVYYLLLFLKRKKPVPVYLDEFKRINASSYPPGYPAHE